MRFVARVLIPGAILIAGIVLLLVHGLGALGFGLIIIAVLVWLTNVLGRLTLASGNDREREDRARAHYAQTGHWPDEKPR